MMKKCLLGVILFALTMPACQKGDNDPYLSVRTRKNRLSGTWNLESYNLERNFGRVRSAVFDKDEAAMVYTLDDSTFYVQKYHWEMNFDREGKFVWVTNEDILGDSLDSVAYSIETKLKGSWEFTGGNNSPAKSQLLMLTEEQSSTRSDQGSNITIETIENPVNGLIYNIDRLSNDELWIQYEVTETEAFEERTERFEARFTKAD